MKGAAARVGIRIAAVAAVCAYLAVPGVARATAASVGACVDHSNHLTLRGHGSCPAGSHAVSVPLSTVRGATGPRGATGGFQTVMAAGRTLTGTWLIGRSATAATQYTEYAMSFTYPFAAAPAPLLVVAGEPNGFPTLCKGSVAAPTAARGYVCIYAESPVNVNYAEPLSPLTGQIGVATRYGWGFETCSAGPGIMVIEGSWAATAA